MKIPVLLVTFLCCIKFVSAQLVSVSIGPSFAVGDYGNMEVTNEKASQADIGYTVKITNEFFGGHIVSPSVFLLFNNNAMSAGQFEVVYPTIDFIPLSPYSQVAGGFGLNVQTKNKGMNVGVSGNIGLANYTMASFMLDDLKSSDYVKVKPKSVTGAMFFVGYFMKIPISNGVLFNLNVDYMMGDVDYGTLSMESHGIGYSSTEGVKLPFRAISAQVGLSFNFQHISK